MSALPIETTQVLRTSLMDKAIGDEERRRLILAMDANTIAHRIIKDEVVERRLHILAIARRLLYCFDMRPPQDNK